MTEKLSAYEIQRLENIKANEEALKKIGIIPLSQDLGAQKKQRKRDTVERNDELLMPTRVMPKRNGNRFDAAYFSEQDKILDSLEDEMEIKKYKRSSGKRPVSCIKRFADANFDKPKRTICKPKLSTLPTISTKQHYLSSSYSTPSLQYFNFNLPPLKSWLDEEKTDVQYETLKTYFCLRYIPSQLVDANYSDEFIQAFQKFCDDHAHLRFPKLLDTHTEYDITKLAHAVTNGTAHTEFENSFIIEYEREVNNFVRQPRELEPYNTNSYASNNPRAKCKCGSGYYAFKNDLTMRARSCCKD